MNTAFVRATFTVLLLALVTPPSGVAQQIITEGSRIRLLTSQNGTIVGTVEHTDADTLWLVDGARATRHAVPIAAVKRLEVRQAATRGQGAWKWTKRGFLIGTAAGVTWCITDRTNCTADTRNSSNFSEGLISATMFFGGGGAFYGAVGGALFPGGRWERIPLHQQPSGPIP